MVTFRKFTLHFQEKDVHELFLQLFADTEKLGYFSHLNKYYRGEFFIEKPLAGNVDTINKEFKINWVDLWRFGSSVSTMTVKGKFTRENSLEIKIILGWHWLLRFVPWIILLSVFTFSYFEGILAWAIILMVITIQFLLRIINSKSTEIKILEYVEKHMQKVNQEESQEA
jgi:hypothetical protein